LIVVVVWGLNFIAIKVGLQQVPPLLLGTLRFIAAVVPAVFFLPRPPVSWKSLIGLGLSINVGQFAFLFLGMKMGMPAGLASLVNQAQAFFTLAIAVMFLGERWYWHQLLGLLVAACGMAVIGSQQGAGMTALGFWLTLLAAASWGIGNIIMRQATKDAPPFSMLSLVVWSGAVAILPLGILSWIMEGPGAWESVLHTPKFSTVAAVIYLAYFATLGGYGLWGRLLSRYPAAMVSPFALLVPVVGLSGAAILLKESISWWQAAGVILVMAGLAVHMFGGRMAKRLAGAKTSF
jgi:O-acetylserine/cysteine efflux transporter